MHDTNQKFVAAAAALNHVHFPLTPRAHVQIFIRSIPQSQPCHEPVYAILLTQVVSALQMP